jgi:hypothetical protein
MTIGQVLGTYTTDVGRLSDGEFDVTYLLKYRHQAWLENCCQSALQELWDEPYLGRVSNARVMGRAMELLRQEYGVNAPRGWYPAMKRLRGMVSSTVAVTDANRTDANDGECASEGKYRFPKPEEVLTNSALFRVAREAATSLEQQPEVRAKFIRLAAQIGVPETCPQSINFMAALELDHLPPEVIAIYRVLIKWDAIEASHAGDRPYEQPSGLCRIRERLAAESTRAPCASR